MYKKFCDCGKKAYKKDASGFICKECYKLWKEYEYRMCVAHSKYNSGRTTLTEDDFRGKINYPKIYE